MALQFGYIHLVQVINGHKRNVSVPAVKSDVNDQSLSESVVQNFFNEHVSKMCTLSDLTMPNRGEFKVVTSSNREFLIPATQSSSILDISDTLEYPPLLLGSVSNSAAADNQGFGAYIPEENLIFGTGNSSPQRFINIHDSYPYNRLTWLLGCDAWGVWLHQRVGSGAQAGQTLYSDEVVCRYNGEWKLLNISFTRGYRYSQLTLHDTLEYPIDINPINIIPEPRSVQIKRGESVTFSNTLVYEYGLSSQLETAYYDLGIITARTATMQGNTLTISPNATTTGFTITVKPSEDSNVSAIIDVTITDAEGEYSPGGNSGPGGGGGSYGEGETSNPTTPLIPDGSSELNASKSGLFTLYRVSSSQLESLGNELYAETFLEKLKLEVLKLLWNSPIEGVISCMSYPFNIPQATVDVPMKFGSVELATIGNVLDSSSMTIDWGTVSLSEYWGNFLDYAPHTQIDLYLPWGVGFVNLNPHDVLPGNISIKTNIDIAKGVCVHHVIGNHGIIGTYSGICASQFPITAIDTAGKYVGMTLAAVGAMVAGAGAVAGSSVGSSIAVGAGATNMALSTSVKSTLPALSTYSNAPFTVTPPPQISSYSPISRHQIGLASGAAVAAMRHPPHVQRSGNFSNAGVGLSPQKPFIIISRPEQNVPEDYGHMYGYPSNITSQLSYLRGYTEVAAIHLEGIGNATLPELEEIEKLLIGGVIL